MCTQDQWGTARWLLLPWQQNGERGGGRFFFFSVRLDVQVIEEVQRIREEGSTEFSVASAGVLYCVVCLLFLKMYFVQCTFHILVFKVIII